MATISLKIQPNALEGVQKKLLSLTDRQALLRPVALSLVTVMTNRIHGQGKAADGTEIGSYSNSYLKQREAQGRGKDKKVIVSLTRQLENDWAVIPTANGYGIGFLNPDNQKKKGYVENHFRKKIFKLTSEERALMSDLIKDEVKKLLSGS